jgi:hypothetical protein
MALLKRLPLCKGLSDFFSNSPLLSSVNTSSQLTKKVHPVNDNKSNDIPAHEANGDDVFSEWLSGGLRYFKQLRNGGPPGFPLLWSGKNSGGGRFTRRFFGEHHPSVTFWNDQHATILGGQGREIYPPLADSESKKRYHPHSLSAQMRFNHVSLTTYCLDEPKRNWTIFWMQWLSKAALGVKDERPQPFLKGQIHLVRRTLCDRYNNWTRFS